MTNNRKIIPKYKYPVSYITNGKLTFISNTRVSFRKIYHHLLNNNFESNSNVDLDKINNTYKFTIIRQPLDRYYSGLYEFYKRNKQLFTLEEYVDEYIEQFLEKNLIPIDEHTLSQYAFLQIHKVKIEKYFIFQKNGLHINEVNHLLTYYKIPCVDFKNEHCTPDESIQYLKLRLGKYEDAINEYYSKDYELINRVS